MVEVVNVLPTTIPELLLGTSAQLSYIDEIVPGVPGVCTCEIAIDVLDTVKVVEAALLALP